MVYITLLFLAFGVSVAQLLNLDRLSCLYIGTKFPKKIESHCGVHQDHRDLQFQEVMTSASRFVKLFPT
jgi:hypothetical protein